MFFNLHKSHKIQKQLNYAFYLMTKILLKIQIKKILPRYLLKS